MTGVPPKGLLSRVALRDDCHDFLLAYRLAARSRQQGYGGPQALLLTEVQAALDVMDVAKSRRMVYVGAVQILDTTYLDYVAKKQAQQK
jgi:hypothetical protein